MRTITTMRGTATTPLITADQKSGNGDDDQIGSRCEVQQALATFQSVDLGMSGIDEPQLVRWIGASQIGEHGRAEGARTRACAHQGDRIAGENSLSRR